MRIASTVLICAMLLLPAAALSQNSPPASRSAPAEPKHPATAESKKKGTAGPASRDPNGSLAPADRAAIELDLAWAGFFTGLITGEPDDKITPAIKAFQRTSS
jgi:hypothetical protein